MIIRLIKLQENVIFTVFLVFLFIFLVSIGKQTRFAIKYYAWMLSRTYSK